jgi:hypothetical protein
MGGNGSNVVKTDKINFDKDSFRTSMLIMGFLCFPLVVAGLVGVCVRWKSIDRLNKASVSKDFDLNKGKLGKWIDKATSKKKRNGGFTRLKQDSWIDRVIQSLSLSRTRSGSKCLRTNIWDRSCPQLEAQFWTSVLNQTEFTLTVS